MLYSLLSIASEAILPIAAFTLPFAVVLGSERHYNKQSISNNSDVNSKIYIYHAEYNANNKVSLTSIGMGIATPICYMVAAYASLSIVPELKKMIEIVVAEYFCNLEVIKNT